MAQSKSKKSSKKKSEMKPKAAESEFKKTANTDTAENSTVATTEKKATNTKEKPLKGLFARKSDPNENILTVFKSYKIWGALLGEFFGTMFLALLMLTLGVYQPLYIMFGVVGITMVVYALSGAHCNPAVTAGMMATRRVSAIRGVLYIVAQVLGAWVALLLVNAFRAAGGEAYDLPQMIGMTTDVLFQCLFVELIGAMIIGFFFARAQHYRTPKGAFTYGAIIAGGVTLAYIFAIVISGNFLGLSNNFMINPAVAVMYQIFPSSAENIGVLLGGIAMAALVYILAPMIGSIIGFFAAEINSRLAGEEQ